MSSIKITSLLALVSTVAAVPQYGAHGGHSKFHSPKPSAGQAFPTGGWAGAYNSTAVGATGTGAYDDGKTTTLEQTSTSTQTQYSTIYVNPSSAAGVDVDVADVSTGAAQCGGTVTVTASEKVTVTVTPGGGADVPASSAAPIESKSDAPAVSETPAPEYPAETPAAESSTVAEYPAETPVEESTTAVETPVAETTSKAEYAAETPEATTSEAVYSSVAVIEKPVASSAVSSATPSATSTPSSGNTYSGTKRGLAYNEASLCSTLGGQFGFGYNWGQTESNDIGTNFIPMMHGPSKSSAEEWLANVDKAVENGSNAVMGFNECDHADQCNLEPEAACSAWKEYMNPVKEAHSDVTIIGPSITNGQSPMGLNWLTRFMDSCPDATVDATNIHFYDQYDEGVLGRFTDHVEKAASNYGKKVWVTEFGLNPGTASEEQAASFLQDAMSYLDGSNDVQGYSWFMVGSGENQLYSGDALSAVGKVYAAQA